MLHVSSEPLYPAREIGYVQSPEGIVFWELPSGRHFAYDRPGLWLMVGINTVRLATCPTWQDAMQWSCGYDAGRTLPLSVEEKGP